MSKESEVIDGTTITTASNGGANAIVTIASAGGLAGSGSGIWKTKTGGVLGPGSADVNPYHAASGGSGPWSPGSPGAALPWSVGPVGPVGPMGMPGKPGVTLEDVMDMYKKAGIAIASSS